MTDVCWVCRYLQLVYLAGICPHSVVWDRHQYYHHLVWSHQRAVLTRDVPETPLYIWLWESVNDNI